MVFFIRFALTITLSKISGRAGVQRGHMCEKCATSKELESWDPLEKTKNEQVGVFLKGRVNKKSSWKMASSSDALESSWNEAPEAWGEFSPWTWEWQRREVWKQWEWAGQQTGPTILNDQD